MKLNSSIIDHRDSSQHGNHNNIFEDISKSYGINAFKDRAADNRVDYRKGKATVGSKDARKKAVSQSKGRKPPVNKKDSKGG